MNKSFWLILLVAALVLGGYWTYRQRVNAPPGKGGGPVAALGTEEEFARLMQTGKNLLDRDEAAKALPLFQKAMGLRPTHPDVRLNLAVCYLALNQPTNAVREAQEALALERNSAAGYFLLGCANLRQAKFDSAIQALQSSLNLDPNVATAYFQLGLARMGASQFEEAVDEFTEATRLQTNHPAAYFQLSQAYNRLGQTQAAAQALEKHQQIRAQKPGSMFSLADAERCKHTQARLPFKVEQPAANGIKVAFTDITAKALGAEAAQYRGPAAIVDFNQDGRNSLFVREGDGFRLLAPTNGAFQPLGPVQSGAAEAGPQRMLVGDLQNNRQQAVVVLGEKSTQVFRLGTNGVIRDVTPLTNLKDLAARDGLLADLDFTGKLDLLATTPGGGLVVYRNHDNLLFREATAAAGLPANLAQVRHLVAEDWNGDDVNDLFAARDGAAPLLLTKLRGGALTNAGAPADWPVGSVIAVGDFNNDLRTDLAVANADRIEIVFGGLPRRQQIPLNGQPLTGLVMVDYDNDGWLDLFGLGRGGRVWRNLGNAGFKEATAETGLAALSRETVVNMMAADLDNDGDTDFLMQLGNGELRLWRNDGGNSNHQLKIQLQGNRSNANGLGVRLEVAAGGLRFTRRVQQLPIEVGVGQHRQVDALTVNWFDLALSSVEIQVENKPLVIPEIVFPKGSCPYFYAWDGAQFRFVSDFLSASPLGLPVAEGRYVEADPREYVWIGNTSNFKPRDGFYQLQITEELSEALYLDEARLVVVDHPAETVVHSTSKMVPGKPFPPAEIWSLHAARTLRRAVRHDGLDVTAALQQTDRQMAAPAALRIPQLRGQAEPWSVTLDFGPLPVERPLVLALTGWIRFGGGMGNLAAARNPELPFPFPTLEVETASGVWQKVDVVVGTPAGKTKTILVDLAGQLPSGAQRLRLSTAFEIYWDNISLFEHAPAPPAIHSVTPSKTDLHYRGYSMFQDLPAWLPLTPDYNRLLTWPYWNIIPAGWCTRYGEVKELLVEADNALVIVNGGDELTLSFAAQDLPPLPAGFARDFFLYSVGWDKDTDFHIAAATTVAPLPWQGLDDQLYGRQTRPNFPSDAMMKKFNTRWVGAGVLNRNSVGR